MNDVEIIETVENENDETIEKAKNTIIQKKENGGETIEENIENKIELKEQKEIEPPDYISSNKMIEKIRKEIFLKKSATMSARPLKRMASPVPLKRWDYLKENRHEFPRAGKNFIQSGSQSAATESLKPETYNLTPAYAISGSITP